MRKSIELLGLGWMLGLVAMACTDEGARDEGDYNKEPLLVTFDIGVPADDEIMFTRQTQDESEMVINRLAVYDFIVKPRTMGADTVLWSVQYPAKASGTAMPDAGYFVSGTGNAKVCLSLPDTPEDRHVFVFVANEKSAEFDAALQLGISLIDDLRRTSASIKLKNGQDAGDLTAGGAVMTGKTEMVTIEDKMNCEVKLQRIVARVDVKNNVAAANNFKLVSVDAENCAATGFMFEQGSDKSYTAEENDYSAPVRLKQNTAITAKLEALATGETCRKVLYMYEHLADSCGKETPTPTLLVSYTLNGSPHTMKVPMKTSVGARFDIKRNRLYTLVVGDVTTAAATRIVATIREEGKEE